MRYWTIILFVLLIVDCIVTVYIGEESNPLILWVMSYFNLSLKQAMVWKMLWSLPFLYILNKYDWSRFTVACYVGLYFILVGFSI